MNESLSAELAPTPRDGVRIIYFAFDLNDAADARRVTMLRRGGASVTVLGFHRRTNPPDLVGGVPPISFGRTADARLAQRIRAVFRVMGRAKLWSGYIAEADAVVARNLEMLVIACTAARRMRCDVPIVYELLDIHRLLSGHGLPSRLLRGLERWLLRRCRAVIVSSPAFVREHLDRYHPGHPPAVLVENKVALDGSTLVSTVPARPPGPPWRIGWFGNLRCRKSLYILARLAADLGEGVEIDLRGIVSVPIADHLSGVLAAHPNLRYHGTYRYPDDLPVIYGRVHFAWAIDYYEEGLNSAWLLPNRLYESCAFGAVPLAQEGVETGAWLDRHGLGLTVARPEALRDLLSEMTPVRYENLLRGIGDAPRSLFVVDAAECRDLVRTATKSG